MRFARLSALLLVLPLAVLAQENPTQGLIDTLQSNINIEGLETSYDPATQIATAIGEVHIKYGDTEIASNRADYNTATGDVKATGNVTVIKAGETYKGENLVYNVQTGALHGNAVRGSMMHDNGTLFYSLNDLNTESKTIERVDGTDAYFTTHDLAQPNYRVKAKRMTIYPNDRVVMHSVTVYAGKTPVFWFPYVTQPLDDELGYKFTPGYSSNWGAFLLNQYGVIHGDHTLAQYKLDLRSTRGVAIGADFISLKQKDNDQWGKIKFYYTSDSSPLTNRAGENRVDVPTDRYRINFQHRIYITGPAERTWFLDFDINKISDQYFYEDFFQEEFRNNREPDNQVSLVRSDPRYTATLMAKFQLNDFYRTDTRLPELAFDFTRQPIFNSGFFYQGSTSFGLLKEKLGSVEKTDDKAAIASGQEFLDGTRDDLSGTSRRLLGLDPTSLLATEEVQLAMDNLQAKLGDVGFTRFHTYHEALFPKTAFGWLTLVPRIGVGYQHYSSIDGVKNLSSDGRALFQAGLDASFKVTKTWEDVQNERLGLNGLKHTMQPYLNYSYLNADDIAGLPQIDRNTGTTRPRPLDIPFYTGIDSLRSWNIARVGVRNLLQTKRDYSNYSEDEDSHFRAANESNTQTFNWAGLNTYVDVFFDDPEPGFDRTTSNLYNELFWRPTPWITFKADTQVPMGGDGSYTEANYSVTWLANSNLSITLGHRLISDHPFFQDSSLLYSSVYARLNENWGVSMNHQYEMDDSTLEYQSYSIHRDLNSWVATLGALVRNNRGTSEYGFIFSMTLKAFPQVSIPLDTSPNPNVR